LTVQAPPGGEAAERLTAPLAQRVMRAMGQTENWLELLRFALVGISGYVVNLVVFGLATGAGADHRLGATVAFAVAVTNNFVWNRGWTFPASHGRVHHQALRFLIVSLAGFGVNIAVLEALVVGADLAELPAQALAVAVAMPVNFLGNRQWTFKRPR
jgi:putative flippase GtrA